jgi:hypothetical protein
MRCPDASVGGSGGGLVAAFLGWVSRSGPVVSAHSTRLDLLLNELKGRAEK